MVHLEQSHKKKEVPQIWHSIVYMSLTGKDTHDTLKSDSKLVYEGHIHVIVQNLRSLFNKEKAIINRHHRYHFHHKLPKLFSC